MNRSKILVVAWNVAVAIAALLLARHFMNQDATYHASIVLDAHDAARISLIRTGYADEKQCLKSAQVIADTLRKACTDCTFVEQQCFRMLTPRQQRLLSRQPVDVPVIHLAQGVLVFEAPDAELVKQSCRQTAVLLGKTAHCTIPSETANLATALATASSLQMDFEPSIWPLGQILLFAMLVSAMVCGILIRTQRWHGRYSHDAVDSGPQKFHTIPVPRIGGVALACAIMATIALLDMARLLQTESATGFTLLALAALPAFAGGLAEDITKKVGVLARLLLTISAGVLASLLVGATLNQLEIPGIDWMLQNWALFAIAFTAFAVGGVANAINIMDGYNGLAGGLAVLVLAAYAWVSLQVGDQVVLIASLTMLGAVMGFLLWNWPGGRIFMGDGGAYLLGFWLAELGVLLVVRNPQVSPWFPLTILAWPIWETLFSMYRRKILRNHEAGHPDALHLHQLIYQRLVRIAVGSKAPADRARRNSGVAPYVWTGALLIQAAALAAWHNTVWLIGVVFAFVMGYVLLYRQLTRWQAPRVLIRSHPKRR